MRSPSTCSAFSILLFLLGVLIFTVNFHNAVREIPQIRRTRCRPGAIHGRSVFRSQRATSAEVDNARAGWRVVAGSQVMVGFIEGFRLIEGHLLRLSFRRLYLRSTILLSLPSAPFLAVAVLTGFGKQARGWLIKQIGLSTLILCPRLRGLCRDRIILGHCAF